VVLSPSSWLGPSWSVSSGAPVGHYERSVPDLGCSLASRDGAKPRRSEANRRMRQIMVLLFFLFSLVDVLRVVMDKGRA